MAEISVTAGRKGSWLVFEWLAATEADTFADIYLNHNVSDMFMEVEGTFGSATVSINGWVATEAAEVGLVDPAGTAIALLADGNSAIRDAYPFMRPVHSGGTSETVDVRIYMKVVQ